MCVDSVAAVQALNRAINEMTDGEVAISVLRPERRRHFRSEHEPRIISTSPPKGSNLVGHFPQARVFEIPTSTGIVWRGEP